MGTAAAGALGTQRAGECAILDRNPRSSRKRFEIDPWSLWIKSLITDDRSMSIPMILSDLETWDARVKFLPADLCNYAIYAHIPFDLERPHLPI